MTELIKIHDIRFPATVEMATRWAGRWGEKRFLRFAALRRADTLGQAHPEEAEPYYRALLAVFREAKEQDACFTVRQLAITGCDLMGLGLSGPGGGGGLAAGCCGWCKAASCPMSGGAGWRAGQGNRNE